MSQLVEQIDDFGKDNWWFTSEIQTITYAKCYLLLRGYHYALSVQIETGKDLKAVDEKLHRDYEITYDKSKAKRRRNKGEANIRMVRNHTNVLVLATDGERSEFFSNPHVVNLRKDWLYFGKHKFTITNNGKERLKVRVRQGTFDTALQNITRQARSNKEELEKKIRELTWYWSKDTLHQRYLILKAVNRIRKSHKLPQLMYENIKRESYKQKLAKKKDTKKKSK